MPELTTAQKVMLFRPRKRFGYSQLLGTQFFGYSRFGEYNEYAGQYQYWNSWGQRRHIRTRFYWPTNPNTPSQQATRQFMRDAMSAWAALTSDEKAKYNDRAYRKKMNGSNLFVREYRYSH